MTEEREIDAIAPVENDGSTELTQRDVFRILFNEPRIRNYVFAALGSLAMILLILLEQGSNLGGMLIVLIGVSGVLLRFTAAPVLIILILTYFMWSPFGLPGTGYSSPYTIEDRRFHFIDVMLVLSVLVYCASQFRLYGLVYQAIASDGSRHGIDEPRLRRPASLIRSSELAVMLGISVGLVLAGQLVWLIATTVQITPANPSPLGIAEDQSSQKSRRPRLNPLPQGGPGTNWQNSPPKDEPVPLSPGETRFFVLLGFLFFGSLTARLAFGYWRLRTLSPAEGRMILLDTGWDETHRERVRLEKWRIWGRKRVEAQSQALTPNPSGGRGE
jgi:hypothetical protein